MVCRVCIVMDFSFFIGIFVYCLVKRKDVYGFLFFCSVMLSVYKLLLFFVIIEVMLWLIIKWRMFS